LTLEETFETETFGAGAALRTTGFGAGLRAFAVAFGLAAFLAAALTGFFATGREGDLAALALFAFGLAVVAFATRFAVLAGARFVFERDAGRRTPFARLLLMGLESQKAAHFTRAAVESPGAYHRRTSRSIKTVTCGCFRPPFKAHTVPREQQRKMLMAVVCYAKVRLAYARRSA
jgi:hypothetical protein